MVSALLFPQAALAFPVDFGPGFTTHSLNVDGDIVSVTVGGHGPAVVLIHGYAEDSRMWKPLAIELAPHFTVIAPDLPGIGNSAIPTGGSNMSNAANRVRDAVHCAGISAGERRRARHRLDGRLCVRRNLSSAKCSGSR